MTYRYVSHSLFIDHSEIHSDSWSWIFIQRAIVGDAATVPTAHKFDTLIAPAISILAVLANIDCYAIRSVVAPECLVTTANRAITNR